MIKVRKANERGHANHGWLDSYHSFSFADYYDPRHMGFRSLRVINEDRVAPGGGFPTHGHRDMEIVSYVLEGGLSHRDSLGTGSVIRPGDVQRMSAGGGVTHSEFNTSKTEPVHFLQIWLEPNRRGVTAGYEQQTVPLEETKGRLRQIVAPVDGDAEAVAGVVRVHQDARVYVTRLSAGQTVQHALAAGRHAYVHVARGQVRLGDDLVLDAGDAAALSAESAVVLSGTTADAAEVLVFDLA